MLFVVVRHWVKHKNNKAHVDNKLTTEWQWTWELYENDHTALTTVEVNRALLITGLEFIFLS